MKSRLNEWFVFAIWIFPVTLYATSYLGPGDDLFFYISVLSVAIGALSASNFLLVLPYVTYLAPLAGLIDSPLGKLAFSDLLTIIGIFHLAFYAFKEKGARKTALSPSVKLRFVILTLIFLLSYTIGLLSDYIVNSKPILYLGQLFVVGGLTAICVKTYSQADRLFDAWRKAIVLGAILLISAFLSGRSLDILKEGEEFLFIPNKDIEELLRATYFYAGFHFSLGLGIIYTYIKLVYMRHWKEQFFAVLTLILLVVALLFMFYKTILFAVLATIGITMIVRLPYRDDVPISALARRMVLVLGALALVVFFIVQAKLDAFDLELIANRLGSTSSFEIRLEIFANSIKLWLSNPIRSIIGFGPSFLDASGNAKYSLPFKISPVSGVEEGTVDSGWLSYSIELGFFGITILFSLTLKAFRGTLVAFKKSQGNSAVIVSSAVLLSLVFLIIGLTTQMLGYTKTAWFPLQVLIIALSMRSYFPATNKKAACDPSFSALTK